MTKLFISYARKDQAKIHPVARELQELGFGVWMDVTGIKGGEDWGSEIVKAITDCDYFLLFISSTSIESDDVRRELKLAHKNKKNIIPLKLEKVSIPVEWEYQTIGIEWIECNEANWKSRLLVALGESETKPQGELSLEEVGPRLTAALNTQLPSTDTYVEDPLSSLKNRLTAVSKQDPIPVACIGGVYLDFIISGIKLNEDRSHRLDFTREVPIELDIGPGGSIYHVARYLSVLGHTPLVASYIGDGSNNGFSNIFFELAGHEKLGITDRNVRRNPGAATAVTIHFVHPEHASSAMYTARDVLKDFGWRQALEILKECEREDNQIYDSGAIYIAGFFKTALYRHLHKNLTALHQNGAVIFLDHGRLEPDQSLEGDAQIRSLADALPLVDIYFSTKEEFSQFLREIARSLPEHVARSISPKDSFRRQVDQLIQEGRVFPPIMLIKDRTGKPRVHQVAVRSKDGRYEWNNINAPTRAPFPIREYIVGSSNAFNAGFIDAFLGLGSEINFEKISLCAEVAKDRMVNVESGRPIDDLPNSLKGQ